jgi:hypothetical protein
MGSILWLASYPKSGNTWLRAFLHNLLSNARQPFDINEMSELTQGDSQAKWFAQIDPRPPTAYSRAEIAAMRPKVHALIAATSSDSVLVKTHNALIEVAGVATITPALSAGAIYVVRNPLDVAISYAPHLGRSFDDIISLMEMERFATPASETHVPEHHCDWSTHVKSWTHSPSAALHVVRYEDMAAAPLRTFAAVAKFLGLSPPRERLQRAIRFSSFKTLRGQEDDKGFIERTPVQQRFFRAGRVGEWRRRLSEAQVRRIVEFHREQMSRFDYVPKGY